MKRAALSFVVVSALAVVACSTHPSAREVVDRTAPVACDKVKQCNGDDKFNQAYATMDDCIAKVKSESEKKFGSDLDKASKCTDDEVTKCLDDLKNATCPPQQATQLVVPPAPCDC